MTDFNINWSDGPDWANAVVSDIFGNLYWVEAFGSDAKRQEFGSPATDRQRADTPKPGHDWDLVAKRV